MSTSPNHTSHPSTEPLRMVIAQARTGSSRLPRKVLQEIEGKPLLLHFVERVLAAKLVDHLVIATTHNDTDDEIVSLIDLERRRRGDQRLSVARGDEFDVLDRTYHAAAQWSSLQTPPHPPLHLARITSDCPLIAPEVIDLHLQEFARQEVDYLSSRIQKRTWPHGMEVECFSFSALQTAWRLAKDPYEREHVTPYLYLTHPHEFQISELTYHADLSHLRLTVDYPEDLAFTRAVFHELYNPHTPFTLEQILDLLAIYPELQELNACRHAPAIKAA